MDDRHRLRPPRRHQRMGRRLTMVLVCLLPRKRLAELEEVVPKFSKIAQASVLVIVGTGLILLLRIITSVDGFWGPTTRRSCSSSSGCSPSCSSPPRAASAGWTEPGQGGRLPSTNAGRVPRHCPSPPRRCSSSECSGRPACWSRRAPACESHPRKEADECPDSPATSSGAGGTTARLRDGRDPAWPWVRCSRCSRCRHDRPHHGGDGARRRPRQAATHGIPLRPYHGHGHPSRRPPALRARRPPGQTAGTGRRRTTEPQ